VITAIQLAEAEAIERLLAPTGPGWCVLTIGVLGGAHILLVREVPPPAEIPPEAADLPSFTLNELDRLGRIGGIA
jgi:hypothetical protein